jgi:hypothetical protein
MKRLLDRSFNRDSMPLHPRIYSIRRTMNAASFTLLLLTLAWPALAQKPESTRPPIVDVHVHLYAKDDRWTHQVPNPVTGQPMTATTEEAHRQATLAEMKKHNVVKAVASNSYEAVLRAKAAAPDTIIVSYAFDDPSLPDLNFLRKGTCGWSAIGIG